MYDVETHFDLHIKIPCPDEACNRISLYSGSQKDAKLSTREFYSEDIIGIWKKDQIAAVYVKIPRKLVEVKGMTLWICIGTENSCKPFDISPAESLT